VAVVVVFTVTAAVISPLNADSKKKGKKKRKKKVCSVQPLIRKKRARVNDMYTRKKVKERERRR
jgi:hypothetical protein